MALVFRCDGCERLEGHDPRNRGYSKKAGTITLRKDDEQYASETTHVKDLCVDCIGKVDRFIKELVKTTTA